MEAQILLDADGLQREFPQLTDDFLKKAYEGKQLWWKPGWSESFKIVNFTGTIDAIPGSLARAFRAIDNGSYIISGRMLLAWIELMIDSAGAIVTNDDGGIIGFVDDSMVNFCWNKSLCKSVSALNVMPPPPPTSVAPIATALTMMVKAMAATRNDQVEGTTRRENVNGAMLGAFRAAARFEATSKLRVTLEGDKLKLTFEDVVTLREVLGGDIKTEGCYGVGTKFKLLPPFVVLLSPASGSCWVRCEPEVVKLPSGLNFRGRVDVFPDGYIDLVEIS